jgi:hypothetical protein
MCRRRRLAGTCWLRFEQGRRKFRSSSKLRQNLAADELLLNPRIGFRARLADFLPPRMIAERGRMAWQKARQRPASLKVTSHCRVAPGKVRILFLRSPAYPDSSISRRAPSFTA